MKISHRSCNVVLLPPKEVSNEAIRLSKLVAENFPVEFVLDGEILYPHLTLYQLEVPIKNLSIVKKQLSKIFQTEIIATFDHYFGSESGSLSWDCPINEALYNIHKEVVETLSPLREGLLLPLKKLKYNFLTDQHFRQIKKFGSPWLFEIFRPHITITRLKDASIYRKALQILPQEKSVVVRFKKAALGKLSVHGTVTDILEEFTLH